MVFYLLDPSVLDLCSAFDVTDEVFLSPLLLYI